MYHSQTLQYHYKKQAFDNTVKVTHSFVAGTLTPHNNAPSWHTVKVQECFFKNCKPTTTASIHIMTLHQVNQQRKVQFTTGGLLKGALLHHFTA
jgi:hypothetical protein